MEEWEVRSSIVGSLFIEKNQIGKYSLLIELQMNATLNRVCVASIQLSYSS